MVNEAGLEMSHEQYWLNVLAMSESCLLASLWACDLADNHPGDWVERTSEEQPYGHYRETGGSDAPREGGEVM